MRENEHCRPIKTAEALREVLREEIYASPSAKTVAPIVSKATPAFLVQYPYGYEVVRKGQFQVPCPEASRCAPCTALNLAIKSASASIPLSLVVKGAVEAFLPLLTTADRQARSRPLRLLSAGEFFGVFETLDALLGLPPDIPPWWVSAGARSVFVLTSRMSGRTEKWLSTTLRDEGIRMQDVPALIGAIQRDDWELVRHLSTRDYSASPEWTAEVLVLPGAAHVRLRTDPELIPALISIVGTGWRQSRHFRGQLIDEETILNNAHLTGRKIKQEDRIAMMGVLRQILAMARGELPAFGPATDAVLPLHRLQKGLSESPDPKPAIVVAPQHLRKTGDVAFVSIRFNCLPAQGSRNPRSFAAFCSDIGEALHHLPGNFIDLANTQFPSRKECLELLATSSGGSSEGVSSRLPFLTACLKLVRGH